jgi:hypothetical protein
MTRANFENLRIYELSEKLSDQCGSVSHAGTTWQEILLASSLSGRRTVSEPILRKEAEWPAGHCTKRFIGLDALTCAI